MGDIVSFPGRAATNNSFRADLSLMVKLSQVRELTRGLKILLKNIFACPFVWRVKWAGEF
jgi:hypothetical protein